MKSDFKRFKELFLEYQKLFGCTGYKVYFEYASLENAFADINVNQVGMIATVRLASNLAKDERAERGIDDDAKHEAIHLLIGRLDSLARNRYATQEELYQANEEIVFRLEKLIPDIKEVKPSK